MSTKSDADVLVKFGNHVDLLHPSKYLKACDLRGKEVTVVIEHINPRDELQMKNGRTEKKPTVKFKGHDKLFCLNKTNAQAIAKIYGPELTAWLDKPVVLYAARVMFGREEVDAVRVKGPKNGKAKPETNPEAGMDPATGEFPATAQPAQDPDEDPHRWDNVGGAPMDQDPGSNG